MAMLKTNMELSEKDGKNCLHENLTNLPAQMVDTRGLYQRRTPCMQIERSLENIEAMVLQEDEGLGPETIKLFPKSFPEKETYANLKSRLNELSAADNVGLAYIAKSLPVTANMDIKYKTPGEVIMDVCLIRQRSPTVILSVVTDMSENMKLQTQRYNSALSKELTKNVRKFTTVTFNSIYGLVHEKELMSKETFESSLARIEKERSRLCVPDSLSMNKEKYKHVVRAFLSSMTATEFVSGEDDGTLWFLTHKQFCILTENIDHTEVHVDTFPASGGRVLSLTVCQRLQKLGRTLLISDDDTLIKRARNHDIDCKTFSDLEQRDLAAEESTFYVVICEGGEHSSSQVPHLPLLLEAGQKRWVFHIQKSSEMEENPAYWTSMEAAKSSSSKSEDPVPFVKAEMQDNPVYLTSDNTTEDSTPQLKDKDEQDNPFNLTIEPSSTNHPTHVKAEGSCCLDREIRMVLVGKTGVGKSATGNTIIGAEKWARSFKAFATSVTKKCKQHSFNRFGYDLQLVDVPGFCDTSRSDENIKYEVMKCVGMSSPGIHAILFVMRIGRITAGDETTLEKFLQCFGKEAKRFVIVVFTGKDDLEGEGETIDHYLCDCPVKLKHLLFDTSPRFIAVNNRGTDEEKETFTKELIGMIQRMVDGNGGECYTNEMYERCEADLPKAKKTEKLDEMWQKLEKKLKKEAAAMKEEYKRRPIQMQEMVKQVERERKESDEADQLRRHLKAVKLIQKEVEEMKRLDEEKKRQAKRYEVFENVITDLERTKEELRLEQARKHIREEVEDGDTSYLQRFGGWLVEKFPW